MLLVYLSKDFSISQAQVTVTSSTTWTTLPSGYNDGITINSNITLNIGQLTLDMNSGKSITLNSGAKLILDGTVIQANGMGSNTWSGIILNGTDNEHFSTFPDPKTKNSTLAWSGVLDGTQTKIELSNNCQIKNAVIGIKSIDGAIIRSKESTFLNCEIGAQIDEYRSINQPKINACYFMKDQFLWDNNIESISSFNFANLIGIKITDAGAINIGGCTFENSNPTAHCLNERGIGIKAFKSDFTVEKDGNQFCNTLDCSSGSEGAENCYASPTTGNGCQFNNLFRGIEFISQSSRNDQLITRYNSFTDNFLSMFIERCNAAGIFDNTFSTTRSNINAFFDNTGCSGATYSSGSILTDIEGFGAHQLRLLQNEFVSDDQFVEHLRIFNSSSTGTSLIKANSFNSTTTGFELSDEVIGILSQGNNSNLNIICNNFANMGVDIFNVSGATLSDLPLNQNTLKNASNTFSSISGFPDRFNILNDGNNFDYTRQFGISPRFSGITFSQSSSSVTCTISCDDVIDVIDNSGVGIYQHRSKSGINIYPNPVDENFKISENLFPLSTDPIIITIYDELGNLIKSSTIQNGNISVSELSNGIYLLLFKDNDNSILVHSRLVVCHD